MHLVIPCDMIRWRFVRGPQPRAEWAAPASDAHAQTNCRLRRAVGRALLACVVLASPARGAPSAPGDAPGHLHRAGSAEAAPGARPDRDHGLRHGAKITVHGSAVVRVAPDRAFLSLAVESRDADPAKAQAANAVAMAAVRAKLSAAGLGDDRVRTLGYQLDEEIDWHKGERRVLGFKASNTIEVRIDAPGRSGEILALAVEANATSALGIRFDTSDRAGLEKEALRQATADSRQRADAAAAGARLSVVRVLSIEEAGTEFVPRPALAMRAAAMAETAPPVPITAGELEIVSHVTMTVLAR